MRTDRAKVDNSSIAGDPATVEDSKGNVRPYKKSKAPHHSPGFLYGGELADPRPTEGAVVRGKDGKRAAGNQQWSEVGGDPEFIEEEQPDGTIKRIPYKPSADRAKGVQRRSPVVLTDGDGISHTVAQR